MSLLPPQFQAETLKTLGPPIRKDEEKKPVEVEVRPGIYRVNGKLETRIQDYFSQRNWDFIQQQKKDRQLSTQVVADHVSEVDIPLPDVSEWRIDTPPRNMSLKMRMIGGVEFEGALLDDQAWPAGFEWLDEGR